jgi:hypothetical protein
LMGIVTFGNTDTEASDESEDWFCFRNGIICWYLFKIIEKDIPEFQFIGIVLTI